MATMTSIFRTSSPSPVTSPDTSKDSPVRRRGEDKEDRGLVARTASLSLQVSGHHCIMKPGCQTLKSAQTMASARFWWLGEFNSLMKWKSACKMSFCSSIIGISQICNRLCGDWSLTCWHAMLFFNIEDGAGRPLVVRVCKESYRHAFS